MSVARMTAAAAVLTVVCLANPTGAANAYRSISVSRHLERPSAQKGVNYTTSYVERAITWPTSASNTLEFDYAVDSEASYDFLNVKIDGSIVGSWSGLGKAGHAVLPVTAGTHTVRFEYVKDGSVSHGLDTAWVDDIRADSDTRIIEDYRFSMRGDGTTGWTLGGTGGGWTATEPGPKRVLRRPSSHAFLGYQSAATRSSIQRYFNFTGAENVLAFDYLVDSETNYDFLRVYVDGVQQFQKSGYDSGNARIPVTAGSHLVRFEYSKDTSVDTGRDVAMVDNITVFADKATVEQHQFDGYLVGGAPVGWSVNGTDQPWVIGDPPPVRALVSAGSSAVFPTVDGSINLGASKEYDDETVLRFADIKSVTAPRGSIYLRGNSSTKELYLGFKVAKATVAAGGENGTLTLYFNTYRQMAIDGTYSCGVIGEAPTDEDRKIVIQHTDGNLSVTHFAGSCGGWFAVDPSLMPVTAVASEPASDPSFFHIEVKVTLPEAAYANGKVGFAARHSNSSGVLTDELFPSDALNGWSDIDMVGWGTLEFGSTIASERGLEGPIVAYSNRNPSRPRN